MPLLYMFLVTSAVLFGLVTALWIVSLLLKNAGIVDIFWGIGFVVIAWIGFYLSGGYAPRKILICTLVTVWGIRLAAHIAARNCRKPEDFRYAAWRKENGARWWWVSYFKVFLLQGFLMCIIGMPILAAQASGFPAILTPLDVAGASLWTFGLLFESIADRQLARFKAEPVNKGRILATGIWKYSRHPNYFGEAMLWWGIYLVALAAGYWWTVFFSPLLMTYLLVRVSGAAMLERTMKLKPGYDEYMRTTSAFFPWFPKR